MMLTNMTKTISGAVFLAAAAVPGMASAVAITGQINHIWAGTGGMHVAVKPESAYGNANNYYCYFPNSYNQMGNAAGGALVAGDHVRMGCKNSSWSGRSPNYYGGTATYFQVYKGQ